jgi:hypothetical protein
VVEKMSHISLFCSFSALIHSLSSCSSASVLLIMFKLKRQNDYERDGMWISSRGLFLRRGYGICTKKLGQPMHDTRPVSGQN